MALGGDFDTSAQIIISILLIFLLIVICCFPVFCYFFSVGTEINYDSRPSMFILYVKAFLVALFPKKGRVQFEAGDPVAVPVNISRGTDDPTSTRDVPNVEKPVQTKVNQTKITAIDCRIDHVNLSHYAQMCLYGEEFQDIPPCYLETYFMHMLIIIVTSDHFKLSPIGLIHIGQSITQHTCLEHLCREPFDLEASVVEYRLTGRGTEVDILLKAFDRREMCVWEGIATLLSRNKETQSSASTGHERTHIKTKDEDMDSSSNKETLLLKVPGELGVKYAKVSGDWNPHHLWPWSARLLGYNRPIAHGMWTMSRCLAWLYRIGKVSLKPPYHVSVQFKRPLFMPGSYVLSVLPELNKDKLSFSVSEDGTGIPQLYGTYTTHI